MTVANPDPKSVSERLASIITEITALESRAEDLSTRLSAADKTISELNTRIQQLEARIKELIQPPTTQPPAPTPQPPPPSIPSTPVPTPTPSPTPPVSSAPAPDVTITFAGIVCRPQGPGELWPLSGERRWTWDVTPSIRVILDAVDEQRRIILDRSSKETAVIDPVTRNWSFPAEEHPLTIVLDGVKVWDKPVRIHPQTRPCMTFRRRRPARFSLEKPAPRYSAQARASAQSILDSYQTNWQWDRWEDANKPETYDNWSERYGLVIRSWTGGVPLANEGAMFPVWDVALMLTGSEKLYDYIAPTWDSSGSYCIHFHDRATGQPYRPETLPDSIPVLKADGLPVLTTKSGVRLPVPDIAHDFGLVNYAALLTGERFYVEELESWTLLGEVVLAPPARAAGVYISGQWRSTAWRLRNLFHLYLALPDGPRKKAVYVQLHANLTRLNNRYADPNSPEHHPTGILNTSPFGDATWLKNATPGPISLTGNLHFLAHVISEIKQSGIGLEAAATPILNHLLKVARGTWEHSPSRYMAGWLKHVRGRDWPDTIKMTFNAMAPYSSFAAPLTMDIVAWWRAAVVAAADAGQPWGSEALAWVDAAIKASGKQPSLNWMIEPRARS